MVYLNESFDDADLNIRIILLKRYEERWTTQF
jgi:hypothetical protein